MADIKITLPSASDIALSMARELRSVGSSPDRQKELLSALEIRNPARFFDNVGTVARELLRIDRELKALRASPPAAAKTKGERPSKKSPKKRGTR